MEDDKIIALYWARKEEAISETDRKYGSYCRSISFRILNDKEDSEECVNDTWLHTWNAIPPGKPEFLAGFLGKIVRNLSISKYRAGHAQKRGSGETQALLDELEECRGRDRGQGNRRSDQSFSGNTGRRKPENICPAVFLGRAG